MEFLLIMGIGTVFAIVVVAFQPKSGQIVCGEEQNPFAYKAPPKTPAWKKDLSEVVSMNEMDYMSKLGRHSDDPRHWPAPLPPPPVKRPEYETEYN
ncbi:MAG TPA: hypothetical protein VGO57_06510 [Verrucomicrobiae bacterium]|jgi:hypothetical protein